MSGLVHGLLITFGLVIILNDNVLGQCPVDPRCDCVASNNSNIRCYNVATGEVAKFLPTNVYFKSLSISGRRIDSIVKGAFEDLPVVKLTIFGTGISEFECRDFDGLENSLTHLSLSYNRILATLPGCAIGNLKKMTSLKLAGSRISRIRNDDFLNLTLLTYLSLSHNKIVVFEGLPFRVLSSLKTLYLRGNEISTLHVRIFDQLTSLQYLDMDYNAIVDLHDTIFLRNADIETISLGSNQISSLPEKILTGLVKLRHFSISRNRLTDLPPILFKDCPNLTSLDVSSNMLTYLEPTLLRPLKKLRTLDLENNRISSIADNRMNFVMADAFRYVIKISTINLQNNSLSTLQSGAFRNLPDLQTLRLSHNKLTEIPPGVLKNSTRLSYLFANNNNIRNIPQDLLEESSTVLVGLYMDNNNLSLPSILHVFERLPFLRGFRGLRLSDTKLPPLSADILTAFGRLKDLRLRNCSLNGVFPIHRAGLPGTTDLSNNNLKSFGNIIPVEITSRYGYVTLNVSNNDLTHLNVNVHFGYRTDIYAENNNIRNASVAFRATARIGSLRMRNNRISNSVTVTNTARVNLLDLSYNDFTRVESSPVNFTESRNPCALGVVTTLNLSRNAILHVSPEACLGGVKVLDLSYNQLQSLGALTPASNSSAFRLSSLYLAGNRLHAVSSGTFTTSGTLQFIDLRSNQIAVIPDLRNLLSDSNFKLLYLSNNPLRCDCSALWMRSEHISLKIDPGRCHSPPDKELFLSPCYDVTGCGTNAMSTSVLQSNLTLCKEDAVLVIRNVTADNVDKEVVIHWSVQGPGTALGYRLTYELPAGDNFNEKLYHPETRSAVLSSLLSGHLYNVCIQAQVFPDSRTERVCMEVEGAANAQTGPHVTFMAFGIALGACVLINVTLVACLVKSKRNVPKSSMSADPIVLRDRVGAGGQEQAANMLSDGPLYENVMRV